MLFVVLPDLLFGDGGRVDELDDLGFKIFEHHPMGAAESRFRGGRIEIIFLIFFKEPSERRFFWFRDAIDVLGDRLGDQFHGSPAIEPLVILPALGGRGGGGAKIDHFQHLPGRQFRP